MLHPIARGGRAHANRRPAQPRRAIPGVVFSLDAAMERIHDLFIGHYDEPDLWEFTIWLGLTSAGKQFAHELISAPPR
jgi:hypothetical protein